MDLAPQVYEGRSTGSDRPHRLLNHRCGRRERVKPDGTLPQRGGGSGSILRLWARSTLVAGSVRCAINRSDDVPTDQENLSPSAVRLL